MSEPQAPETPREAADKLRGRCHDLHDSELNDLARWMLDESTADNGSSRRQRSFMLNVSLLLQSEMVRREGIYDSIQL